ncbi:hypothetical protein ACN47E_009065 [Coniothyrium glycines]
MTEVMTQPGLGMTGPSSRQDIVSALLYDYGTSFGHGDESPSTYSPVPALKELPPPPPPRADNLRNRPLPAVQRMSMKFPLRDNDSPSSPASADEKIPQRRRIASRSLSRDGKPPSLKLTVSNGSTATIPPTPVFAAPHRVLPSSGSVEEKDLPPPPPAKSIRRKSEKQMGNQQSRKARELARNDSLLSPGEPKLPVLASSEGVEAVPIVKRKALPEPGLHKFKSLAELNQGPRGGKGGPLPPISAPREGGADNQTTDTDQSQDTRPQEAQTETKGPLVVSQLPPTPDDEKDSLPLAPPRKVFTGLPSNPRANGPTSPLHLRGKSSTGLNILKAHRPAPPIPTMNVNTITPQMTPSPTLKPSDNGRGMDISPVSPLPPPSDQRRPFSFEPTSESQSKQANSQQNGPAHVAPTVPTTSIPARKTTLDMPSPSPTFHPSSAPARRPQQILAVSHPHPASPPPDTKDLAPPPPFSPLTRHPISLPMTLIPQITPTQLECYTAHRHNIWSNNHFQALGCMVCRCNDKERKWACTWCQLRVCRACSEELRMIPGRDLGVLLRSKLTEKEEEKQGGMEGNERKEKEKEKERERERESKSKIDIVVQDVDEEEQSHTVSPASRAVEVRDEYDPFRD